MKSVSIPSCANSVVRKSCVPPYRQFCASRCSPGVSTVSSVVEIAAMPLAATRAASPFSIAASLACSAMCVGVLLSLMYFRSW